MDNFWSSGLVSGASVSPEFPPHVVGRVEIGIISDTHGLVRPEVYEAFEGVDLILHAGDIGSYDVILELEPIAPVKAVVGNVDVDLGPRFKEEMSFEVQKRTFHLQHILKNFPEEKEAFAQHAKNTTSPPHLNPLSRGGEDESPSPSISEIFIFGHSHKPMNHQAGTTLYFNPGSAGPRRFKLPITVGHITLEENKVTARIISLES